MTTRLAALALFLSLAACDGTEPDGVCCPVEAPCDVGENGGWAETMAACEAPDGDASGTFVLETDEHGCTSWERDSSSCPGVDMCCTDVTGLDDAGP